jgi:ATP-dependent Lon protease
MVPGTDFCCAVCDNAPYRIFPKTVIEIRRFPIMSEAFDKVRGVRELPLFPLPVVLFPGMPMPLHIFEPRYRKMMADIRAGDNLFGLSYFDSSSSDKDVPPAGHVGCVAEVTETQALPDGRSNILAVGVIRYRVEDYVERGDSYLVVRANYFEDKEEDAAALVANSREVAAMFMRVANAIRVINDERGNLPDISDTEPQKLSFLVAAAMEIEVETKQELLELRSTSERLARLRDLLARVVKGYEERARLHSIAKGNGHGGKKIEIE